MPAAVGASADAPHRRDAQRRSRASRAMSPVEAGQRPGDLRAGAEPAAVDHASRTTARPTARSTSAPAARSFTIMSGERHVVALDRLPDRAERHGRAARGRSVRLERRTADLGPHPLVGRHLRRLRPPACSGRRGLVPPERGDRRHPPRPSRRRCCSTEARSGPPCRAKSCPPKRGQTNLRIRAYLVSAPVEMAHSCPQQRLVPSEDREPPGEHLALSSHSPRRGRPEGAESFPAMYRERHPTAGAGGQHPPGPLPTPLPCWPARACACRRRPPSPSRRSPPPAGSPCCPPDSAYSSSGESTRRWRKNSAKPTRITT